MRTLQLERARHSQQQPILVLVTDGRANVSDPDASPSPARSPLEDAIAAAHELRIAGVPALVIDTEEGPVRMGLARTIAEALDATYIELATLEAAPMTSAVRTALHRTRNSLKRAKTNTQTLHSKKKYR